MGSIFNKKLSKTFDTLAALIASDMTAANEGDAWQAGNYAYAVDSVDGDIVTAGGVSLRYVFDNVFYLGALGDADGSTLRKAIERTDADSTPIYHSGAFSDSFNTAETLAFLGAWDRVHFLTPGARIVLDAGNHNMGANFIDLTNPYHRNLEVTGKQYAKRNLNATTVVSQAAFDHRVQLSLQSLPAAAAAGNWIIIDTTDGPDGCKVFEGVCEIISIDGPDLVTVRVGYPFAALPTTASITGRYRLYTTCLEWTEGRGLAITTIGGTYRNMIIKGPRNPIVDAFADGPNDGVLIGEQANTHVTGSSESAQVNTGWAEFISVGVTNWLANGFQNKGGKMRGVDLAVSNCGHRGFQSGNSGGATVKGLVSTWNANGLETESGSTITATEGNFSGNFKQGAYTLNGKLNISDGDCQYNGSHGMDAGYMGNIQALRVTSRFNALNGILCDDAGKVVCEDGEVSGNNTDNDGNAFDVKVRSLGDVILTGSTVALAEIDVDTGGRAIDPNGLLIVA